MIDIHAHILFNVDDGPRSIEGTMHMLEQAIKEGITDIIATPHAYNPRYSVSAIEVISQIGLLTDVLQAAEYPVSLHAGQEIRLHENLIENITTGKAIPLANSRYLLLELPSYSVPTFVEPIIQSLLARGNIPIIAHPERNHAIVENPRLLEKLIRQGALGQVTAGSITGHFGKRIQKTAIQLIEANLIHTYGSDVHNLTTRPLLFEKGLTILKKKMNSEIVDILLENNKRIVKDATFILIEPEDPVIRRWWRLSV